VAEGLTGAHTRGCSGDWKVTSGGGKEKGAPGVPTVGEGGRCGAGGKLGAMQLEARGGEALGGIRCGEEQRCLECLL
jgi:hypothetical protein